jgi:glycosyltransferase involved in cell wall biosynthesis
MNGFGDSSISWIVYRLIQHSDRELFQWHVSGLCGLGTMQKKFDQLGAYTIDFSKPINSSRYLWQRIREYLLDHEIRIIHTHTPRTIFQASLATKRLPRIIHIATKHLLTTPGDRKWGLPISTFDRFSLYLPDHLVAVSQTMARQIIAQPGIDQRQVTAIRNAIPVESFFLPEQREACRREFGLSPQSIAIGFAGRMEKVKRIDLLLYAHQQVLYRFPEACLVLVGEGSKQDDWRSMAESLGVSQAVIWAGFRTDMPRVLAALDAYVVPSVNEGLSLSILEALAAGKPVIATDVGGTSEVIVDDLTGILVSPGSYQMLAAAIIDLLNQPDKRARLSQAGRNLVLEQFNVKRMTDAYCKLYMNLVVDSGVNLVKCMF